MASVTEFVEVDVPVRTAYNQWTQFETFPQFMDGVEQVTQLDDKRTHWRATIAGKTQEWDAEITEQIPDERVAWKNTTGATNAGVVTFHYLAENKSRVTLQLDYEPEGLIQSIGSALNVPEHRIKADLKRFKEFIESRGSESGEWRGTIQDHPTGGQ